MKKRTTRDRMVEAKEMFSALASEPRLRILKWLEEPEAHFAAQKHGDLRADGVCGSRIAEKLGFRLPTVSRHMKQLVDAGLIESKRIKQWTFYRRTASGIEQVHRIVDDVL
ncbi:helix-turn-helix domain-containing protein [Defluviimonas sp. WL0024]|uniref:Helix-turn-helix domain-containing protein n=1 Tax=Albidovulum salinarum TaxID=2984153 RepID=A0ABT2X6S5_9RHOB|nr:metalloregulator ArsR/SmtB family transcription factor [Defluviimonas sp. WL0024]MCU9849335.1 helix-turn-helix domain-containing protein [Defluviimonas sp. WL0024]